MSHTFYISDGSAILKNSRKTVLDRGRTDRVTALPRLRASKIQVQSSVGSKDRVMERRTDRRDSLSSVGWDLL